MNQKIYHKNLLRYLLYTSRNDIDLVIEHIHPEDILDSLRIYDGDKKKILKKIPKNIIADIIDQAEDEEKYELLSSVPEDEKKYIIDEMSSDELTDMLGFLPQKDANEIIVKMDLKDANEIRELMSYDEETAAGIMATEFISVNEDMTVEETLEYLQNEAPDAETAYYIYVLNDKDNLRGVVTLRDLVISNFNTLIKDIMNKNVITVPWNMDQEEVGLKFEKYGLLTMPVVDPKNVLLGIVTVDDIMEVLQEENTEDIYRLAGLDEEEKVESSVGHSVKKRLPWLYVNMVTAILASATVSLFEGTIQTVVALATFMPIVAGMGGNAGTQTLTLIVRGIALGELNLENSKNILLKELGVGILNGIAIGISIGFVSFLWVGNIIFGIVIGLALILNLIIAAIAGFSVPMLLKKLDIDPALASSVFVTTMTDVLGFFFFLGLATILIEYL